jgi:hypothetical protein
MLVKLKFAALKETQGYEYLIRFVLGGLTTVVAGIIADEFGPATGGLFLAFPAIFCASATMIEKHERQHKEHKGLKGSERGRGAAGLDAAGASWGSLALAAFAFIVFLSASKGPALSLALASLIWLLAAAAAWLLRRQLMSINKKENARDR